MDISLRFPTDIRLILIYLGFYLFKFKIESSSLQHFFAGVVCIMLTQSKKNVTQHVNVLSIVSIV
jgi:hypothetical protein